MNKEHILKEILQNKDLREKYWPEIDVEEQNIHTLIQSNNKYLAALYYIFEEQNKTRFNYMIRNIKETFAL